MLRCVTLVLMAAAGGSGAQLQETVERTVMVRTTGSDLQPAATGYIYKKRNDGEESVVQMGESEVMEQLAKLYERPKTFAPPATRAKQQARTAEQRAGGAEAAGEERVIPVKENAEDHIDGLADDDYKKIFDEYSSPYNERTNTAYEDYLRSLKHFKEGLYQGYRGDSKYDDDTFKKYKEKYYGDGDAGDYHNHKFDRFASNKSNHSGDRDESKELGAHPHDDEHQNKVARSEEPSARGFHVFGKDDEQQQKDHSPQDDGVQFDFHKLDAYKYSGVDQTGRGGDQRRRGGSGEEHGDGSSSEESEPSDAKSSRGFSFDVAH